MKVKLAIATAVALAVFGIWWLSNSTDTDAPRPATLGQRAQADRRSEPLPPTLQASSALAFDRHRAPSSASRRPTPTDDATKLVEGGMRPREVYDEEPRTEPWATAMEETLLPTDLREQFRTFFPEAGELRAVCHTSTCEVSTDIPSDTELARLNEVEILMQAMLPADIANLVSSPADDDRLRLDLYLVLSPDRREPSAYDPWAEGVRSKVRAVIESDWPPSRIQDRTENEEELPSGDHG